MGRGLDGFLILAVALCSFEGLGGVVSRLFPVALARGKHLFPFRTEQLSPSAPMVLGSQGPGRVGRRRFFVNEPPSGGSLSLQRRQGGRPCRGQGIRRSLEACRDKLWRCVGSSEVG
jgi:hypothetical protein